MLRLIALGLVVVVTVGCSDDTVSTPENGVRNDQALPGKKDETLVSENESPKVSEPIADEKQPLPKADDGPGDEVGAVVLDVDAVELAELETESPDESEPIDASDQKELSEEIELGNDARRLLLAELKKA